jgi:hypothetical protein
MITLICLSLFAGYLGPGPPGVLPSHPLCFWETRKEGSRRETALQWVRSPFRSRESGSSQWYRCVRASPSGFYLILPALPNGVTISVLAVGGMTPITTIFSPESPLRILLEGINRCRSSRTHYRGPISAPHPQSPLPDPSAGRGGRTRKGGVLQPLLGLIISREGALVYGLTLQFP